MDSHQYATKGSFHVMEFQNQDGNLASTSKEPEDCAKETNQLVQELDPLNMPIILEKVFSYLDLDSIKNARQVNPLWSIEGAKMLMNKCYVQIPRDAHQDSNEMNKFKVFLFLKSSDRSMIPNITITTIGDFDLWNSLGVLGPQVKVVKLKGVDKDVQLLLKIVEAFKAFLSLKAREASMMMPSIAIEATADADLWNSLGVLGPQVKAVQLKSIEFEDNLLQNILDLLPNLMYLYLQDQHFITNFNTNSLRSVMLKMKSRGVTLIVPNVALCAYTREMLPEIEKISNYTNILIKKLHLYVDPAVTNEVPNLEVQLVNIMSKLLSANQNTIKRLHLNNCQLFLSLLEFPCMAKLTRIDLDFFPKTDGQLSRCKFPPSFRFAEKVPNLQQICALFDEKVDESLYPSKGFSHHLFENTGPAPSVKSVECFRDFTGSDVKFLFKQFPNLEDLKTCSAWYNTTSWYASLWTLGTNLRKLRLHFGVYMPCAEFDLDSIFTGFSPKTVERIKNHPNLEPYTLEELEELRVNPSILNLKEMEYIEIQFDCHSPFCPPQRMLTVAQKYAFRLLPKNPKIVIAVKQGYYPNINDGAMKALEEVSKLPNVSVEAI